MNEIARRRVYRASSALFFLASASLLAACASDTTQVAEHHSKEYFSEKQYGVKASPRVSFRQSRLPRGGGREQIGDPYQVAGRWYYPKDYKHYTAVGAASWYGDAFHGRLTANGEVYDDTDLTAAHPTLPLPCYARVTNMINGSSVIVRVNDRGPYVPGRIIDLSKRAAELLDYSRTGVAKVRIDYIGKAPLDGHDEQYLLASYRPGEGESAPGENGTPGVMVAMNGPTPTGSHSASPFPGQLDDAGPIPENKPEAIASQSQAALALASMGNAKPRSVPTTTVAQAYVVDASDPVLPTIGPIIPDRPDLSGPARIASDSMPVMGYTEASVDRARSAFDLIVKHEGTMTPAQIVASWKRQQSARPNRGDVAVYIAVGSFADSAKARKYARELAHVGRTEIKTAQRGGNTFYSVDLYPDGRAPIDSMLREAWAAGAGGAMTIRQ